MKTKLFLKLAALSSIPLLFGLIIMCMVTTQVYYGNTEAAMRFYTGQMNTPLILVAGIVGAACCAFVFSAIITVAHYADNIDRLEDAIGNYRKEKERYEKATEEFASKIKTN